MMFTKTGNRLRLLGGAIVVAALLSLPVPAEAVYMDLTTGLQWLEFNQSGHMTYTQVLQALEPGGRLEGYRYATADEVRGLFHAHGIVANGEWLSSNFAPIKGLLDNLGYLEDSFPFRRGSAARTGTPGSPGFHISTSLLTSRPSNCLACFGRASFGEQFDGFMGGLDGGDSNWLVVNTSTNPIPEPASLFLLASGVAGLAAKRRMRSA